MRIFITLLLLASCGGGNDPSRCTDHVPNSGKVRPGKCRDGAKLLVEDSVAVCRCPEKSDAKSPKKKD